MKNHHIFFFTGPSDEKTFYRVVFTSGFPTFQPPASYFGEFPYDQLLLIVPISGNYTIVLKSNSFPMTYLYYPNFDATNPSSNLISYDNNSAFNYITTINVILEQDQTYQLVLTSYQFETLPTIDLIIRGPQVVNLTQITSKSMPSERMIASVSALLRNF